MENNNEQEKRGFFRDLFAFLKEYSVLGLAIGVIIAQSSKVLIDSIVDGIFMPFISLFVPQSQFDSLIFTIRGVYFNIGSVLSSFLSFLIIMILLYFIVKKIMKNDKILSKK